MRPAREGRVRRVRRRVQHVLMTADAVGGVWTYALELARALYGRGVRTTLATMGEAPRDPQRAAAARIEGLTLVEGRFALEWMDDPWRDVDAAGAWLLQVAERDPPDVVHLNGYVHAALPWRAPCVVVAHSCVLSWWKAVFGEDAPPRYRRYRDQVAEGLTAADVVVAPTRAMLEGLRTHYGRPREERVIANGVTARSGAVAATEKEPLVLGAGRLWDEAKNLRALASIADRVSWPVALAGSERHPDGTIRPHEGARLLGWLEPGALDAWMARASIYALPARYEPFGLSVLEAAAHGCALVLGDIASLRETWGADAEYVPPDDRDALVSAIERLIADPSLRRRRGHAAATRARRLSSEAMAGRYLRLYRELLPSRVRHPAARCA